MFVLISVSLLAFLNTKVENDFSIIKLEKDDFRSHVTRVSLAGIMNTKQFKMLKMIIAKTSDTLKRL